MGLRWTRGLSLGRPLGSSTGFPRGLIFTSAGLRPRAVSLPIPVCVRPARCVYVAFQGSPGFSDFFTFFRSVLELTNFLFKWV